MANLTLKFKDKPLNEYVLDCSNTFAIGRQTANDAVIVNLAVSGYHAEIVPSDKGFTLRDLNSKNGTVLNGKRIKSALLRDGDQIILGKHTLLFRDDDRPGAPEGMEDIENSIVFEKPDERIDQTVIIDTERLSRIQAIRSTPLNGFMELLNSGRGVALNRQLIKIGKQADSDIVITGCSRFLAGKTAATISKRPDGYYISAAGGLLKPRVNNRSIKLAHRLKSMDTIRIGSFKMKFILR